MSKEGKIDKTERQINLLACLLDSPHGRSFDYIKNNVNGYNQVDSESLRRMFERDKAELKYFGASIVCEKDSIYRIEKAKTYLPKINFSGEEILLLKMLSRIYKMGQIPLGEHFWPAMLKISFDEPTVLNPSEFDTSFLFDWSKDNKLLDKLYDAYLSRKTAIFKYQGIFDEKPKARLLDIYGILFFVDSWYVAGRCHTSNEIRCFNTNRIIGNVKKNEARPKQQDYKIPSDFNVRDILKYPWEWGQGPEQEVVLACGADTFKIVGKQLGSRIIGYSEEDGSVHFSLRIKNTDNLLRWILVNKCECEILEPEQLRVELQSRLLQIKNLYSDKASND